MATVQFTLRLPTGQILPGIEIILFNATTGIELARQTTDRCGMISVSLPAGPHRIFALQHNAYQEIGSYRVQEASHA